MFSSEEQGVIWLSGRESHFFDLHWKGDQRGSSGDHRWFRLLVTTDGEPLVCVTYARIVNSGAVPHDFYFPADPAGMSKWHHQSYGPHRADLGHVRVMVDGALNAMGWFLVGE